MKDFSFKYYLYDRAIEILSLIVMAVLVLGLCQIFGLKSEAVIMVAILIFVAILGVICFGYFRQRYFYRNLRVNLAKLDQSYLIAEVLDRPDFLDGKILYDVCYELGKSMLENVSKNEQVCQDFSDYIELWIHEIKSPLAALNLLAEKGRLRSGRELIRELARIDNLTEQILYFMRAESSAKDYLFQGCNLSEVVKAVLLTYRTQIQLQNMEIETRNLDRNVMSDVKWLKFMISQVLANALKYQAKKITFSAEQAQRMTILKIRDDGIGIPAEDLPRVFDKTFTGKNGHGKNGEHSTGMGLYIVKTLADKMGHKVEINSKIGDDSFTEVRFVFGEHEYYKNVR